MKNIKFLWLIIAAAIIGSCNKTLDPKVYSSLTNTNAFNTVSDAMAAVNAVYARLKGPVVGDNFDYWTVRHFALTDLTTDLGHCSYGGDPGQLSLAQWNSSNGLLAEDWRQIYKLIADANNALYNLSNIKVLTAQQQTQFTAEIRFLRSIAYMDLTDAWGPVPMLTEKDVAAATSASYLSHPKPASVESIDSLMIADLTFAATSLPVNYQNNAIYNSNDYGRATKGAALTLLGKLYLREHQWQQAADYMKQVIDMNTYALHSSYLDLFTEANKWCEENIFSVISDANVNGTELMNHFGPQNHPVVLNRWQYYAVSWDFYSSFEEQDERKLCFYPRYTGVDGLIYAKPPTLGATPPAGYSYMPDIATKKYADSTGSVTLYYDGHSVDILRYADVLLSRAEALNELNGPTDESIGLINQVKGRSKATLLSGTYTQQSLRDVILQERGWEFFYEGKRRADLIRFGKYDTIVNAYLTRIGQTPAISMPKNRYFPYPLNQTSINSNLDNSNR